MKSPNGIKKRTNFVLFNAFIKNQKAKEFAEVVLLDISLLSCRDIVVTSPGVENPY